MIKKGWGQDEGVDTFQNYATEHLQAQEDDPGPLSYLKIYRLSCLEICIFFTFRSGKFTFRFSSSLRNTSILQNLKVHANHLDIEE